MFELLAMGLPLVFVTLCHESAFLGEMDFKRLDLSVVYDYYMCVGVEALSIIFVGMILSVLLGIARIQKKTLQPLSVFSAQVITLGAVSGRDE